MKSSTLTWITTMTLGAALATAVRLAAQEQEQQRLETRQQQYSVTDLGKAMALPAQTQQHSNKGKSTALVNLDDTNGWNPAGSLVQARDVNLFGTTTGGAAQQAALSYSVLYTFTGGAHGAVPQASLIRDAAGNLYGTTSRGGLVTIRVGISGGATKCLGPVSGESLDMLRVDAVSERMANHVVGHHPTMPGAGKAAQTVVATRRLENSLHSSIMTIVTCLCKPMAAAIVQHGETQSARYDGNPNKYGPPCREV